MRKRKATRVPRMGSGNGFAFPGTNSARNSLNGPSAANCTGVSAMLKLCAHRLRRAGNETISLDLIPLDGHQAYPALRVGWRCQDRATRRNDDRQFATGLIRRLQHSCSAAAIFNRMRPANGVSTAAILEAAGCRSARSGCGLPPHPASERRREGSGRR